MNQPYHVISSYIPSVSMFQWRAQNAATAVPDWLPNRSAAHDASAWEVLKTRRFIGIYKDENRDL